jgi:hypothetical protein
MKLIKFMKLMKLSIASRNGRLELRDAWRLLVASAGGGGE